MDIETLKIFCDVIKLNGFTQAAAANLITQSAVSQRIKALEKKFGAPLIERRGGQIHLTKAGKAVCDGARRILAILREVEENLGELNGKLEGTVRVGAIHSVGLYELDPVLKQFLKSYPHIEVQIEYERSSKIYQAVINGSVDLGIVAYPVSRPQLSSIPFRMDELVLICPPDHPFAQYQTISLRELASQPFVSFQRDLPTRKVLDEIFQQHGVSVTIKAEFDNIEVIKRAVETGLGVSVVPSMTIKPEVQAGLLRAVLLEEGPFKRPISVLYRRGSTLTPTVKKFISVLTGKE